MRASSIIAGVLALQAAGVVSATGASAVGKRYPSERSEYLDPQTGCRVVQLTRSSAEDVKIYQTHPSWTADGEWIVFHSDRSGSPQLFAVHERRGDLVQITDEPGVNTGQICLSRQRMALLTLMDREVVELDLGVLLTPAPGRLDNEPNAAAVRRTVGRLPAGAQLSGTMSWGADEQRLYLGLAFPDRPEAQRWSVASMSLDTGRFRTLLEPGFRVGHVQANPWSSEWLMYCQETGGDAAQRMWLIGSDGTGNRPFYRETFDEWVTHEVWRGPDQAMFTVWPKDEAMLRNPHGIATVTLGDRVAFPSRFPYWHVTGTVGSPYAVGDTFDGQIIRVRLATGERAVLTRGHRSTRTGAHPHPTLDPAGRAVLFNSNAAGNADLCVVDLAQEPRELEHVFRSERYTRRESSEAERWQRDLRARLELLLRLGDVSTRAVPFNAVLLSAEDRAGYRLEEYELNSTAGRRIRVLLGRPRVRARSAAAVVCVHGHGGDRRSVFDPSGIYKGFAAVLAERGMTTIAADVGQHEVYETGRTLMGERLGDLVRCVDFLETLPEVDPSRIGCAGLSLGGEMAMWLGALDRRVRVTVSSGFLTTMDQMERNHCLCWKFDGLRELVDYSDIYSLIAPRGLLCQIGAREGPRDFWPPLARSVMDEIEAIYWDCEASSRAGLVIHEGGHEIDLASLVSFLEENLLRQ